MDVDPQTSIRTLDAAGIGEAGSVAAMADGWVADALEMMARMVGCPALVVSGDNDLISPLSWAEALTETLPAARLEVFERCGHIPAGRYPARFNILLREFVEGL